MRLIIFAICFACGDTKTVASKSTTADQTKTTENTTNVSVPPVSTSNTKLSKQTPVVKEFVIKAVETSETSETSETTTETSNTSERQD